MKYIKINENGIHIVFGITDKNQIKLLHFSKQNLMKMIFANLERNVRQKIW